MPTPFSLRQLLAAAALALPALSQAAYPERPIEWVVPYAAGGGSDVVARVVAEPMAKALGQSIIILNKPGAATNIGADYAARALERRLRLVRIRRPAVDGQRGSGRRLRPDLAVHRPPHG